MKFLLGVILVLLPSLGFTQEGQTPEVPAEVADEKAVEELEAKRDERTEALESLQESIQEGPAGGPTLTPEDQLKKLGYGNFDPGALFSVEALTAMEKMVKEARMWDLPAGDVKREVLRSFQGTMLEGYVNESPNLQAFLVDFLRDKDALVNSIAIFKDRQRLKKYLYFWIAIMFATYYTKRLFISKFWKKPVRFLAGVMFSLTVSVITLSTFCLIFSEEMKPIITLVKKHL